MPPDSTPVARSRVSWRPKLLRPREPSKSCRVLNPRKSIVLSVISKRASGWRSCGWSNWPRAEVRGGGILKHFAELVAHGVFGEQIAFSQGAEDGFAQGLHGSLGVHLGDAVVL